MAPKHQTIFVNGKPVNVISRIADEYLRLKSCKKYQGVSDEELFGVAGSRYYEYRQREEQKRQEDRSQGLSPRQKKNPFAHMTPEQRAAWNEMAQGKQWLR